MEENWSQLEHIDQDLIEQFRVRVYEYAHSHQDEIDLQDVRNRITPPGIERDPTEFKVHDWMLKKLLISAKKPFNLESAMDKFVDMFRYRAQFRMSKLTLETALPVEFFTVSPSDIGGRDRQGNQLMIGRMKFYRRIPQFDFIIKRATMFVLEQEDLRYEREYDYHGVTLVVDCQEFNFLRNTSLDMLVFMVQLAWYYPACINRVLIHSLPWAFNFLLHMAERWVNAFMGFRVDVFHVVDKSTIQAFIEHEQLPKYLHGARTTRQEVPEKALPFAKMAQFLVQEGILELEEKNIKKIDDYVKTLV